MYSYEETERINIESSVISFSVSDNFHNLCRISRITGCDHVAYICLSIFRVQSNLRDYRVPYVENDWYDINLTMNYCKSRASRYYIEIMLCKTNIEID